MTVANPTPVPRFLARVLELHEDEVKRIAAQNGATNVRLVGSVARGEDRQGSDVDLLVDFGPGRRRERERLEDALEAIDRIQKYVGRGRAAFEGDELIQA